MAESSGDSATFAGVRMIEDAQRSVVQVRSSGRGIGAGVIWPGDGLVLTNHHVVSGRRRRRNVRVALHDGRTLDADVLKSDRSLDLALLGLRGDLGDLPVGISRRPPSETRTSCGSANWSTLSGIPGGASGP
jgi:S1-C subfamily serine protease